LSKAGKSPCSSVGNKEEEEEEKEDGFRLILGIFILLQEITHHDLLDKKY
jgi:hypothetical protein